MGSGRGLVIRVHECMGSGRGLVVRAHDGERSWPNG